ncbi:hypothetical protein HHI36_010577 [Cryptolaemus montrouzieri]|uniref:Ras-GEF domain-containing protein n=1 Tax=Cryptolaemus montrouzieri TaxID=559131 RepID=A0ABD2MJA4_9CUCU
MSINRVQKLLFSEYCDFEDMVLIESPFAQTTKEGQGIRQVYLGLTPTKLVLATDVIPPVEKSCTRFTPGVDPDIETFELIAIYPVECVNLSVFSKQKRQALKAHFCNNSVLYFELGGFEKKEMFWNLWQERIKFLCPDDNGSSKSQTSVASSSTTSTLYLLDSKEFIKPNGLKQVWCKFGTGNCQSNLLRKWTDRYLYMGKSFEDLPRHYLPQMDKPTTNEFVHHAKPSRNKTTPSSSEIAQIALTPKTSIAINRFGNGVKDNCSTTLLMTATVESNVCSPSRQAFFEMAEICVRHWESNIYSKKAHKRRYRLCPHPYFLHGLGPWSVQPGCRFSIQVKRAVSVVTIKRQPVENELRLPISRKQLLATVSYDTLNTDRFTDRVTTNKMPVILFWTPCYWYRPRTAKHAYDQLRHHLSSIKEWRESKHSRRKALRKLCCRRKLQLDTETSDIDIDSLNTKHTKRSRPRSRYSIMQNVGFCWLFILLDSFKERKETPLQQLKKSLRMDLILTAWDFDSTTLAQQLTLIEKELFIRVTSIELGIIVCQQSSKNAPNISAIIAFAHRISCLIGNEILREESEKVRARLIARFINVADKCHQMSNYQSCKTILVGLQSLAVYRLRITWAYVRKKHSTTYQVFEYLCKLYKDVRLPIYQKSFHIAVQDAPCLPQVADILARLLDRVPNYWLKPFTYETIITKDINTFDPILHTALVPSVGKNNSTITNFFSSIKQLMMQSKKQEIDDYSCMQTDILKNSKRRQLSFKRIHNHFRPLEFYEDNKVKCLQETTKFLQHCQLAVMSYSFNRNELARDYLLKARYREDKENFYISLNIEPPIYCDKYLNKKL